MSYALNRRTNPITKREYYTLNSTLYTTESIVAKDNVAMERKPGRVYRLCVERPMRINSILTLDIKCPYCGKRMYPVNYTGNAYAPMDFKCECEMNRKENN